MNTKRIDMMIDLEAAGPTPDGAIVAIGWCAFSPTDAPGLIVTSGRMLVDVTSCLAAGMEIEAETVRWWLGQPPEIRTLWAEAGTVNDKDKGWPLRDALVDLAGSYRRHCIRPIELPPPFVPEDLPHYHGGAGDPNPDCPGCQAEWSAREKTRERDNKLQEGGPVKGLLWAYPATYDLSLLDNAYRLVGIGFTPWERKRMLCARSVIKTASILCGFERNDVLIPEKWQTKHDPEADAVRQAIQLQAAYAALRS